jgi:hypothetical protein
MKRLLFEPGSKAGQLQRAVLAALRAHHRDDARPTNARFLFYELEHDGVVRKSKRGREPSSAGSPRRRARALILRPWRS